MSRMKNPVFKEIALAVGGAHYPEVGGELLEKFGREVAMMCANIAMREDHDPAECIKRHFGIKNETN